MWGWGAMNPTAIKEAAMIRYPMDKFIGVWWSGAEDDVAPGRRGGQGLQGRRLPRVGRRLPGLRGHPSNVYDKGLGKVAASKVGEVLYNRGVINRC